MNPAAGAHGECSALESTFSSRLTTTDSTTTLTEATYATETHVNCNGQHMAFLLCKIQVACNFPSVLHGVLLKNGRKKAASVAWEGRQHMPIEHTEHTPAAPFACGTAVKTVIPQRACQAEQVIENIPSSVS